MGAAIFQQPVTYGYSCDICLTHSRVNEKSFVPCVMVGNQPGKPTPKEPSFRMATSVQLLPSTVSVHICVHLCPL